MKQWTILRLCGRRVLPAGVVLLGLGGCLGPNPGFFVSTSIANATILSFVQRFWNAVLGG